MKKILFSAFSLGLVLALGACSDDSSSSTEVEKDPGSTGGFSENGSIDKDAKKILEKAVKGTDYESVTCDSVSTQVVAGTNYRFQCSMKDGKKTKDVELVVFEPLPNTDKPVQLTLVVDNAGKVLFESEVEIENDEDITDDDEKKSDDKKKSDDEKLKDDRDGQTYKTVKIGDQVWMAENLNYSVEPGEQSWCYNDSTEYCEKFGRLYTWVAAVGKTEDECGYDEDCDLPSGNIRGVCPEGWHMPTDKDWQTLFACVGGKDKAGIALKSSSGWYNDGNGKDSFGFTALPAGNREDGGYFRLIEDYAFFWSATQYESVSSYAYYMSLYNDFDEGTLDLNEKYRGYSVRCIKD